MEKIDEAILIIPAQVDECAFNSISLTVENAKKLYEELDKIFGNRNGVIQYPFSVYPNYPYYPFGTLVNNYTTTKEISEK